MVSDTVPKSNNNDSEILEEMDKTIGKQLSI